MTNTANNKTYFVNLDGCRTAAFLIVFCGHCLLLFGFGHNPVVMSRLYRLFEKPGIGVHFFFVLSGFLISYLLLSEETKYGKLQLRAFYMRRILRIWPVYFMVVLLFLLLSFTGHSFYSTQGISLPAVLFFLTNYIPALHGIHSLPLTVLWSVAVEEQFYLILPLLIVFFGKRIFYSFPLFIAASLIFGIAHDREPVFNEFNTISVCSSLFIGCCCAFAVLYHNLSRVFEKLSRAVIIAAYTAFVLIHLFHLVIFSAFESNTLLYFIDALFFAFFILEQNYAVHSFYKMSRIKLLSAAGKYTYGLYAYHMIFITLLLMPIPKYFIPGDNYLIYFGLWLGSLALSYLFARLSYRFLETPFLRMKRKFVPVNKVI